MHRRAADMLHARVLAVSARSSAMQEGPQSQGSLGSCRTLALSQSDAARGMSRVAATPSARMSPQGFKPMTRRARSRVSAV